MAPHVALPSSSAHADPFDITRTSSWYRAPTRYPSEARSAFHRQVPPRRSSPWLGALLRGPPLVPRLCHREPSFQHAFTGLSWSARPVSFPPIRRSPQATCRPPASATDTIPEHTFEAPSPPRSLRRQAAARRGSDPLTRSTSRAFPGQGLPNEFNNPHRDDRSPRWLYPNLFDPNTSCRKLVPHKTWKPALRGDRAVRWYERTRRMGRTEVRLILKGRHPQLLAKAVASGKARGAFHHQARRLLDQES